MSDVIQEPVNRPMTPREIVGALDKFIIGQDDAKRAVSIALRNRWRRMQLDKDLAKEITPKNILMIGPTGVGKTEIARRLADLADAPFIKVEASKFTEVGYVGRDVESIIRDLVEMSMKRAREKASKKVRTRAEEAAEERLLDILVPPKTNKPARGGFAGEPKANDKKEASTEAAMAEMLKDVLNPDGAKPEVEVTPEEKAENSATRELFRKKLHDGKLDDKEIEADFSQGPMSMQIMGPPGMEDMVDQIQNMMQNVSSKRSNTRRMKVKEALKHFTDDEAAKLLNEEEVRDSAKKSVEQNGIVFIDEIDKIVKPTGVSSGGEVSREGVQRDLLPMVEGCTVTTKYGMVKTDHILFIASGAFHLSKPSDLIPELQGRLPIRVELNSLKVEDFKRILTEPNASLTEQYMALMGTEDYKLSFKDDAVQRLAEVAFQVNENTENIGARRLHTILERLLETISFEASEKPGETFEITAKYVDEKLSKLVGDEDLSRYIL